MTIKNKLRTGIGFLFVLSFICCGLSIYFLNRLSADAGAILKDNYKSLQYGQQILSAVDANGGPLSPVQLKTIETNLAQEEHNITEPGEGKLADSLRSVFERIKLVNQDAAKLSPLRAQARQLVYGFMQLNMNAIAHKNDIAKGTASRATILVAFCGAFLFLVAFSFAVNFPGYIANPLRELTARIKEVSNRNYHQQIDFKSDDEFGELGRAFNNMTRKLDEFENSNLANLLFEKKRIETIINSMHDAIVGLDEK